MVFVGFDSDFAGRRLSQFCRFSVSAGSGRIRQLARRYQGGVRVVSQTRTRLGECAVRQRFFITDWFPLYLVAKGISLKSGLIAVWVPFIAADLGNFFGGTASGFLIKRGWSLGAARKALVVFGGFGVTLLIPTIFTMNLVAITALFGLATFCYAAFSTIANVFPSDLFTGGSVASVSGFSGTGAGTGTIIAFAIIGYFSDATKALPGHSFDKIIVVAGLVPFVGMVLVLLLVRNTRATKEGLVRPI